MKNLEKSLLKLTAPGVVQKMLETIKIWENALMNLVPQSYIEVPERVSSFDPLLFTWFFDNTLANGFKHSGEVSFFATGEVVFKTQSGRILEKFSSYEEAEKFFLGYFNCEVQDLPKNLPQLLPKKERDKNFRSWYKILKKFEQYKAEVEVDSPYAVFKILLPDLERVLTGKGDIDYDHIINFEPGEDWAKILIEKVIEPLKKMHVLSSTEAPSFDESLLDLHLDGNVKELCQSIESWAGWIQELSKKVPFSLTVEDVYSTLSHDNYWFDGINVYAHPKFCENEYRGIIRAYFGHGYVFNGNELPIKIFSGNLTYFECNKAVLNFTGVPISPDRYKYRVRKSGEEFIYDSIDGLSAKSFFDRPLYSNNEDKSIKAKDYIEFLKPLNYIGTWEEVSFKFFELISFINDFMGDDIKRFSPQ